MADDQLGILAQLPHYCSNKISWSRVMLPRILIRERRVEECWGVDIDWSGPTMDCIVLKRLKDMYKEEQISHRAWRALVAARSHLHMTRYRNEGQNLKHLDITMIVHASI